MKKTMLLLSLLIVITFTSSCWSRREIEDLGFVMGLGISKTEAGLYTVVAQLANANAIVSEAPNSTEIYTLVKAEGLTVFDALRNLSMIAKRRLYIAHLTAIVIHEEIAKEGLSLIMGVFLQDMELRLGSYVFISQVPPEEIFDTPNFIGLVPAMGLELIAENYGANSKIFISDLHATVEAVNNPTLNYVTALVEKIPGPSNSEMSQMNLSRIVIFDNDKLAGYLDYEEGQAYNFITNNFRIGLIVFEHAGSKDKIVIEILESSTKIIPEYRDGEISFRIVLNIKGNIAERIPILQGFSELDIVPVQNQLNQVIEDKLKTAIDSAQQDFKIDYFNLSKDFSRKYPKEFKEMQEEWNDIFSNAKIDVEVKSSVIHSALNKNRGRI
ncbi:Ger(x)C family spore germination protein [Alkaliphilus peptidifermentans]|uniref:Germination protein, Ger(X)C family n=1 Tax=Alkaliphilus peptidifermentans DSM 18978 TaxID=1120976 RepID=A0A1G5KP56_9FIRM|nr:Ger(x)C family spore germination protein [Alkaliphilus peptidifermentans]SCZ01729.1 germination protein, Ger(x)C family [Alkaliphilus peptidifermentans DSM 18978]